MHSQRQVFCVDIDQAPTGTFVVTKELSGTRYSSCPQSILSNKLEGLVDSLKNAQTHRFVCA